MLTDVDGAYPGWETVQRRRLKEATPGELNSYVFEAGTMEPKIRAAVDVVAGGGGMAGIGRLEDAWDILERRSGAIIEA